LFHDSKFNVNCFRSGARSLRTSLWSSRSWPATTRPASSAWPAACRTMRTLPETSTVQWEAKWTLRQNAQSGEHPKKTNEWILFIQLRCCFSLFNSLLSCYELVSIVECLHFEWDLGVVTKQKNIHSKFNLNKLKVSSRLLNLTETILQHI